jgi:hypothetical protein
MSLLGWISWFALQVPTPYFGDSYHRKPRSTSRTTQRPARGFRRRKESSKPRSTSYSHASQRFRPQRQPCNELSRTYQAYRPPIRSHFPERCSHRHALATGEATIIHIKLDDPERELFTSPPPPSSHAFLAPLTQTPGLSSSQQMLPEEQWRPWSQSSAMRTELLASREAHSVPSSHVPVIQVTPPTPPPPIPSLPLPPPAAHVRQRRLLEVP